MLLDLIHKYPVEALLLFYGFSNAVGAMPKPTNSTGFYSWLYTFAHGFAGNLLYALRTKFGDAVPPDDAEALKAAARQADKQ